MIAAVGCSGPDQVVADAGDLDAPIVDTPEEVETLVSMCGAVPTTVGEWEACYLKRYCTMRAHCGEMNLFTDAQECIDHLDGIEGGRLSFELFEKNRAVGSGRAAIDPVAFETCLRAWTPKSCNTGTTEPTCATRYVGTIADTQGCYSNVECMSPGATCEPQTCDDSCCMGACTPKKRLGETCASIFACEPGLLCSFATPRTCVTGAVGTSCTDLDCNPRAWCDPTDDTCKPDLSEGAPCDSLMQCGGETACVGLMRDVDPRCRRITEVGDACDWFCWGNTYCDLSNPTGLGTCRPLPTVGETGCGLSMPCTGRLNYCATGRCTARAQVNQSCMGDACFPGLFCTDQLGAASPVCSAQLPDGSPGCTRDTQCESYICDGNQTTTGDCQPLKTTCP